MADVRPDPRAAPIGVARASARAVRREPSGGHSTTWSNMTVPPTDDVASAASEAFEHEAMRWLPAVARFALSLTRSRPDADDLVQETYLQAFRAWHTFRAGEDGRRWLFTICKHLFLRGEQRARRWAEVTDEPELDAVAAAMMHVSAQRGGDGDLWDRLDLGPAIERALGSLPEHYRTAVVLVDVEGYGYEDAAAVLEVPVGTVRSRLFRARRLLQEALFEHARDAGLLTAAAAPPPPSITQEHR
jgi:RNA polymerase sigma-70 factor, ECF subfamily